MMALLLSCRLLGVIVDPASGIKLRDLRALWKSVSSTNEGLVLALNKAFQKYEDIKKK